VESVFHPSDFSPASRNAFAHALAIAIAGKTEITILHAGGSREDWTQFPAVRETLESWGKLHQDSPKSAVFAELGISVKKVQAKGDATSATRDYLERHPSDLIVLATQAREGLPRWFKPSVAEKIARASKTMTLFVPEGVGGIVAPDSGDIVLSNILVPVDEDPNPEAAIVYAGRASEFAGGDVKVTLLHVGENGLPDVDVPESEFCSFEIMERSGDVVDEIIGAANDVSADLIAMTTAGQKGFVDALRGSVTEQVVRRAPCPLLAVPSF